MADEFKPTQEEIDFLLAKRAADEAARIDIDQIRPGMDDKTKAKAKAAILRFFSK